MRRNRQLDLTNFLASLAQNLVSSKSFRIFVVVLASMKWEVGCREVTKETRKWDLIMESCFYETRAGRYSSC
jgi:hypothetical protein